MGRRSNQTTKGGRFMNPADQQRKVERAKELKRNKKQRSAVRQAIMKNRDPDELIMQLRKIDDIEMETDVPLRVSLVDKREKIRKQYREIKDFYQKSEQLDKVKEIELKMHGYEAERYKKKQQMAAIKFSMSGDMGDIPLPDGPSRDNAMMTPYLPSYAVQPAGMPPHRKRVRFANKPAKPPGPPVGMPPDFSDSEDENGGYDQLHDDDNYEPVPMPEGLLEDRHPVPLPVAPPQYPILNLANAPPVHPSMLPLPPRMPLRVAPPPPMAARSSDTGATISAGPNISKPAPAAADAVISAKPELRDLAGEATRFVPTNLRIKREGEKKKIPRTNAMGMATESATKKAAKTTDDAYSDFMKEMEGLL